MSKDSIIYRNTLTMEDVDTEVLKKSPTVVKFVKLLTDDEAVPAILDVATPSAVEVKEKMKDSNEDNKQNLSMSLMMRTNLNFWILKMKTQMNLFNKLRKINNKSVNQHRARKAIWLITIA